MDPQEIDELLSVMDQCWQSGNSYGCNGCPYIGYPDCCHRLYDKVAIALKRLKFLETPTKKEQPELPIKIPMPIEELYGKDWAKEKSQSSGWLRERCPELWDLFTEFRMKNKISFCLCSRTFKYITNTRYTNRYGDLWGGGVESIDDFLNFSEDDIHRMRNIGKKSARLIELVQEYARSSRTL